MNRITKLMIGGGALAATLSVAGLAVAQDAPPPGRMMKMPDTRAEVQAMVAEHFKMMDANKDGFVTRDEMAAGREKMRTEMRAKHRAEMFAKLDTNKDGSISKAEFMAPPPRREGGPDMPPPPPGGPEGRDDMRGPGGPGGPGHHGGRFGHGGMRGGGMFGEGWFERADVNKDNKISLAEAQAIPLAMFDKADTNRDGKLSDAEKQAARQAMRGGWKDRD